ncbi:MAG: hypothetical protein ABR583_11030 [Gaiellaceae bacterium]
MVIDSLVGLSLLLVAAGAAFGLLNVGMLELIDDVVPEHSAVEALAWVTSSAALGAAVDAAAAGALAGSTAARCSRSPPSPRWRAPRSASSAAARSSG